jgi:hypothetical protein
MAALPDIIGSTIGNLLAGGISSIGADKRAARAAAENLFELTTGKRPETREERQAVAELATVTAKARKEYAQSETGTISSETSAAVDAGMERLLTAAAASGPQGKAQVDAFRAQETAMFPHSARQSSNDSASQSAEDDAATAPGTAVIPAGPPITVEGTKNPWTFARPIDAGGIWLGGIEKQAGDAVAAQIDKVPGARVALGAANVGLTIAGGPGKYVAGLVYDRIKGWIKTKVADGFKAAEYDDGQSELGSNGIVLAGSLILNGFGNILSRHGAGEVSGPRPAAPSAPKGTKLTYDKATKSWTTPEGLVYEPGSKHGNRVKHVLDHAEANPNKPVHSVFDAARRDVLGLIDEAWTRRSGPGILQNNGNRYWSVDMGRRVGTAGETHIRIVVRDGTTKVITSYPE